MKRQPTLLLWMLVPHFLFSQVGIGTTTPNVNSILDLTSDSKGLIIPRMTSQQKANMALSAEDHGMLVYQEDAASNSAKGLYFFDGASWNAPLINGTINGQTLRWDGNKWVATNNIFNQGTSIGIGTQNPNYLLQLHSLQSPFTRIQITNATTGALNADGLVMGISLNNGTAHINQFENKPLWFGTNAAERMRIDSLGNVGIGSASPSARLDVNGSFKLGTSGSVLSGIIKMTVSTEVPVINSMDEASIQIAIPNASESATVYVSPGDNMDHIMIGHARVSSPGWVEVKFMNMGSDMESPMPIGLHIALIQ